MIKQVGLERIRPILFFSRMKSYSSALSSLLLSEGSKHVIFAHLFAGAL